jgi:hypothetical protein
LRSKTQRLLGTERATESKGVAGLKGEEVVLEDEWEFSLKSSWDEALIEVRSYERTKGDEKSEGRERGLRTDTATTGDTRGHPGTTDNRYRSGTDGNRETERRRGRTDRYRKVL